jgi:hypothetical protein
MKPFSILAEVETTTTFLPSKRHSVPRYSQTKIKTRFNVTRVHINDTQLVYRISDHESLYKNATKTEDFRTGNGVYKRLVTPIRMFNGRFFKPFKYYYGSAVSDKWFSLDDFQKYILIDIYYEVNRVNEQFLRHNLHKGNCLQRKLGVNLKDPNIQILQSSDDDVLKKAQAECDQYIIIGNHVWQQVEQPIYSYTTFGLGHNHGGTGFFVSFIDPKNIPEGNKKFYFMPEQLQTALDTVIKVAQNRGDTESVESIKKCHPTIHIV